MENINIYGSTIICFIFCFYYLFKMLKTRMLTIKLTKEEVKLVIILLIYMLFTFILSLVLGIENKSIFKVLSTNLFILTFILILFHLESYKDYLLKISKLFSYGLILLGIFNVLLYIAKIYSVYFSFQSPYVTIMGENEMIDYFREIRFQSMFSQKTKFAFYCIIGIFLLSINKTINSKLRYLGIIVLFVNIILTNSITSMLVTGLLLWSIIDFKKINRFLRYIFYFLSVFILVPYVIKVVNYMSTVRDVNTLGSRGIIWSYAFEFYKDHPFGVIDNWYLYQLGNSFRGAHNVFFNEILDYGIIGGLLFLITYILYFYSLYKLDKRTLWLVFPTTILFMIDNMLQHEIVPVFLFTYILIKIMVYTDGNLKMTK
ncbi:hypothetical protein CN563_10420 [Bacillus sp. AFS026049]|nr:hypothetical protein CN563_10420 [Bacillus sp. AFS026049]